MTDSLSFYSWDLIPLSCEAEEDISYSGESPCLFAYQYQACHFTAIPNNQRILDKNSINARIAHYKGAYAVFSKTLADSTATLYISKAYFWSTLFSGL